MPQYFFNGDLQSVVTPINDQLLVKLLKESNYNETETAFLEQGFTRGFNIEYDGPRDRQSVSQNIPFSIGNKTILWNKLMKEVKLGRVVGPFEEVPFDNFIQSPIGLVPKAENQTRLIFHLSYDFKEGEGEEQLESVNYFTPKDKCSVHYRDINYAVETYLELGKEIIEEKSEGTGASYMQKSAGSGFLSQHQLQQL